MLWKRSTSAIAALLGGLVMTGAIAAHVFTPLSILIDGDPSLFMMALAAFTAFAIVLVKRHRELPGLETSLDVAAVSLGAMRRNLTLRFVVVGIAGMFFVALTMMGIVLVQDVQANNSSRDRMLQTTVLLMAGGADERHLPNDFELITEDHQALIAQKISEDENLALVQDDELQAILFILPDGRRAAYAPVRELNPVIVAEAEDLSLTLIGGPFTARAILAWFVIDPALLVFWLLAARVTSHIRNLTQAAEKFGAGDYVTPITAEGEDEVARLAKVFEQARGSIGGFIEEVLGAFPGLLLPVNKDGIIGEHISTRSQELLAQPAGKPISDALFNGNGDFSSMLEPAVADGSDISFDDLMSLAPQRVEVRERTWQLTYAPNHSGEQLIGVLVIGEDITEQLALAAAADAERDHAKMLMTMLTNRVLFSRMQEESLAGFAQLRSIAREDDGVPELDEMFRIVHTFKGSAATMHMKVAADTAHHLEENLRDARDAGKLNDLDAVLAGIDQLEQDLQKQAAALRDLVGEDSSALQLGPQEEAALRAALEQGDCAVAKGILDRASLPDLADYLPAKTKLVVERAAQAVGKEVNVITEVATIRVPQEIISAIEKAVPHILRNAVDHGIEEGADREMFGKSPEGTITLQAAEEAHSVVVTCIDDGGGIDAEAVSKAAVRKGVIGEEAVAQLDEHAQQMLIFAPGFSTAAGVSEVSGRGVGMDAVKAAVEELGGEVTLKSELGEGSTISLRFPLAPSGVGCV